MEGPPSGGDARESGGERGTRGGEESGDESRWRGDADALDAPRAADVGLIVEGLWS